MYSIKSLLVNRIKPTSERFGLWYLTENVTDNNLITDIGNINYTEGEQRIYKFLPITDFFCYNIVVVKISDLTVCKAVEGIQLKVKSEVCGSFNSYLRGILKYFKVASYGVKAKPPYFLDRNGKIVQGIKQVIVEDINIINNNYENPIAIPYKIKLADEQLESLITDLPDILQHIRKEHYYIMGLDITQDFAGIFL